MNDEKIKKGWLASEELGRQLAQSGPEDMKGLLERYILPGVQAWSDCFCGVLNAGNTGSDLPLALLALEFTHKIAEERLRREPAGWALFEAIREVTGMISISGVRPAGEA